MTYPDTYVTNLYLKWRKRQKQISQNLRNPKVADPANAFLLAELGRCMLDLAYLKAQLIDWEIRRGLLKKR